MAKVKLNIDKDVFLPKYLPYLEDYSYRYNVYYGGRASGKTFFIIQKLLLKGLKEKRVILLMRKETNKLRDSVWQELNLAIDRFKLRQFFDFNQSEFRATCRVNGTVFKCLGLDDAEKIKGFANMSDVFLDELTGFTSDDFDLIDGTLRSREYDLPLQIYGAFNPVSKQNWVFKFFGFDSGIVPINTFLLKSTYLDNPHIDPSFLDRMENLKRRNPARYTIEALGDFATLDQLVYPYWTHGEPPDEIRNKLRLIVGLDFGYTNDPTALVAALVDDDNKKLYIIDEFYKTGMTNQEIAQMIQYKGYSKSTIIADSAEPKSIEEIKRAGIGRIKPAVKGKDSINQGIDKIRQYDLIVSDNCPYVQIELDNYCYEKDKTTGEYTNKPIDTYNHALDALRYAAQTKSSALKLMDKSALGL